jgi:hypothetical protein
MAQAADADFAPVLEPEDHAAYQSVLKGLVSELRPVEPLEQILVRDIAHATWEMLRFARLKAMAIEFCYYEQQRGDAKKIFGRMHARSAPTWDPYLNGSDPMCPTW